MNNNGVQQPGFPPAEQMNNQYPSYAPIPNQYNQQGMFGQPQLYHQQQMNPIMRFLYPK